MNNRKLYCGNKQNLPNGYDDFGNLYDCLRIGYGVCKYNGHEGEKYNPNQNRNRNRSDHRLPIERKAEA